MAVKQKVDYADAPRISQVESKALLDSDMAVFVDLRPEFQYDAFHLPGAVRLDLRQVVQHASAVPAGKTIVYYCDCANEETSARAVQLVRKRSKADVRAFVGSVEQWLQSGFPFERTPVNDLDEDDD